MDILKVKVNNEWVAIPSITGQRGIGIQSITKTNTQGLVDTYTILFSDGNSTTFNISNGAVPSFTIGTVTEGPTAAVTVTGTDTNPVLNLTLPNANVPTAVSELDNDAGYATESYVNTAIANVNTMRIHICTAAEYNSETGVPTIASPDTQTFYLVPGGEGSNLFIEWAYVNNAWERFGSADVDLSNYVQKTDYVTQSSNGILTAKDKKFIDDIHITLVNQAKLDNTKEYVVSGGNYQIVDNSIVLTGDGSNKEVKIQYYENFDVSLNDLVYISVNLTTNILPMSFGLGYMMGWVTSSSKDKLEVHRTRLYTITSTDNLNYIGFQFRGSNAASMEGASFTISNLYYINLTKIFGSGNEPTDDYTLRELIDKNFSDSFNIINSNSLYNILPKSNPEFNGYLSNGRKSDTDIGIDSIAIGANVEASGSYSLAHGSTTIASGFASHAEGLYTIAAGQATNAQGRYNTEDSYNFLPEWSANTEYSAGDIVKVTSTVDNEIVVTAYKCYTANSDSVFTANHWSLYRYMNYAHIIGNGNADNDRSNAYALDWDGNGHYMGDVYVGANADSSGGTKLAKITDIPVTDVQVNGTSILSSGVANVPMAGENNLGVVKVGDGLGMTSSGTLVVQPAPSIYIKAGAQKYNPIAPKLQHESVFYGLSKVAGVDLANETVTLGTYPAASQTAIKSMLGVQDGLEVVRLI